MQELLRIGLKILKHSHIWIVLILPVVNTVFRNRNMYFLLAVTSLPRIAKVFAAEKSLELFGCVCIYTIDHGLHR